MKCQLFICLVVLLITIVNAKPVAVDRRGLIKDTVHKTIKTIKKLLFHGKATFFNPEKEGGAQGACGPWADVNSQIVALNGDQYGDMSQKSEWCGKKVKICYEDKCTIATVTDACPTCDHGKNFIDLRQYLCILIYLFRLFGSYTRCLGSTRKRLQ